jgi:formylglycine-generating enzyme required for sulfatase activity
MTSTTIAGIPMVRVPFQGGILASRTPITNGQYRQVIHRYLGQDVRYAAVTRGLNGRIAVVPLNEGAVGKDNRGLADKGAIVTLAGGIYLYKLNPTPSPGGFHGEKQPVVCISPVQVEGWCELAGGEFRWPTKEEMTFIQTGGGKLRFPTATGELFDDKGNRLLHGSLELRDGKVFSARKRESATCDVDDERYPDGPFGTRWGGNVCLWVAGDLLFGGSWIGGNPRFFEGSYFYRSYPDIRFKDFGFGVISAQDSK